MKIFKYLLEITNIFHILFLISNRHKVYEYFMLIMATIYTVLISLSEHILSAIVLNYMTYKQ